MTTRLPTAGRLAAAVALMFMLVYNISFLAAPSISTGRIAFAVLVGITGWQGARAILGLMRANRGPVAIFCGVVVYAAFLYGVTAQQDSGQLSRSVHFLLFSVCGAELLAVLLGYDVGLWTTAFAAAVFLQALFILYSYVSPEYRIWLAGVLVQSGGIPLTYALQVPGFSNSSGAALSTIQGTGVFAALYAARTRTGMLRALLLAVALITAASTVVTGRTGLLMTVVFVAAFAAATARWQQRLIVAVILVAGFGLATAFSAALTEAVTRLNPSFGSTLTWALGVFGRGTSDPVLNDLVSQPIPPLTLDTWFGTGLIADAYGNLSQNDSGYIQTYYALGVPMTALFYGALLVLLGKYALMSEERFLLGVLITSVFVVEYKEPFVFKYALPLFALGVTRLEALRALALRRARRPLPA